MNRILSILLLAAAPLGALAQPAANAALRLDSLFNRISQHDKAMGVSALSHNGQIVYQRAYGQACISGRAHTPDTRFRIGSVTKIMTAAMIMQLAEQGKLKLTTTLDRFFPKIPGAKNITIEHLLRHRSGLHSFTSDSSYFSFMHQPQSRAAMLARMEALPSDFEPGARYEYSNSNYVLLGYIIEDLDKRGYAQSLQQRVCKPAGLSHTYMGARPDTTQLEACSYESIPGAGWKAAGYTDMSIPHGAGAVVSTATDLTRFIEALFNGKIVSEPSLKQMMQIQDGYGLGLIRFPLGNRIAYGHTGGIDGFSTMLAYFPEEKVAIAQCVNALRIKGNDIALGSLSIYFGLPYTLPDYGKTYAFKPGELDAFTGVYGSEGLPIKITISQHAGHLIAQATGQSSFPLEATGPADFLFEEAGIRISFTKKEDGSVPQMQLSQSGRTLVFQKEQ